MVGIPEVQPYSGFQLFLKNSSYTAWNAEIIWGQKDGMSKGRQPCTQLP